VNKEVIATEDAQVTSRKVSVRVGMNLLTANSANDLGSVLVNYGGISRSRHYAVRYRKRDDAFITRRGKLTAATIWLIDGKYSHITFQV